jgi:hypothetical protein
VAGRLLFWLGGWLRLDRLGGGFGFVGHSFLVLSSRRVKRMVMRHQATKISTMALAEVTTEAVTIT